MLFCVGADFRHNTDWTWKQKARPAHSVWFGPAGVWAELCVGAVTFKTPYLQKCWCSEWECEWFFLHMCKCFYGWVLQLNCFFPPTTFELLRGGSANIQFHVTEWFVCWCEEFLLYLRVGDFVNSCEINLYKSQTCLHAIQNNSKSPR